MKAKRVLAVLTAATMVMAMSITAFAGETSGSSEGAGTSEGHVEKKATNVVLPTIAEGSTPFAYTMDPEGLVVETANAKYGTDVVFPSADADKHVYFNNGKDASEKTQYLNTSIAQKVKNKSSHDIDLTVKAEAVESDGGKDIPLVEQSAIADAEVASLYLGLVVGAGEGQTKTAVTSEAATQTVTLAGTPGNFKIAVDSAGTGYEYRVLTEAEWLAANTGKTAEDFEKSWKDVEFSMEGETTEGKEIASDTTAPKLKVTWSWTDPTENAGPSIATSDYVMTAGTPVEISVNLGIGDLAATSIKSVTFKNNSGADRTLATTDYSFANGKLTINANIVDNLLTNNVASRTYTVVFDNDATANFTLKSE